MLHEREAAHEKKLEELTRITEEQIARFGLYEPLQAFMSVSKNFKLPRDEAVAGGYLVGRSVGCFWVNTMLTMVWEQERLDPRLISLIRLGQAVIRDEQEGPMTNFFLVQELGPQIVVAHRQTDGISFFVDQPNPTYKHTNLFYPGTIVPVPV